MATKNAGKLSSKGQIGLFQKDGQPVDRRAPAKADPFKKYQGVLRGVFKGRREIGAWVRDLRNGG